MKYETLHDFSKSKKYINPMSSIEKFNNEYLLTSSSDKIIEKFQQECPNGYYYFVCPNPDVQSVHDGADGYYINANSGKIQLPNPDTGTTCVGWSVIVKSYGQQVTTRVSKHTRRGDSPGYRGGPGPINPHQLSFTDSAAVKRIQSQGNHYMTYCLMPPPSALGGITFSNQVADGFTVTWTGGTNATSYKYTLKGNEIVPKPNNNGDGNTATFTDLTGVGNQTSQFIISAINNTSTVTGTSNVTLPVAPPIPTALGGITFSNQTPTSFVVRWTGGTGATSYNYMLNGVAIPSNPNNNGAGNTATFTGITNLTGGQSYQFVINAKNSGGTVTASSNVTLPVPPPTALGGIIFSNQTPTGFTVKWTGGTGATSYDYTLNGVVIPSNPNNNGAGNTATFTGLSGVGGQSPLFVINARNSSGFVTTSSNVTLPIAPPTALGGVTFSNQTPNSFTVRWTGGTGATSYDYTLNGAAITSNPNNNGVGNTATFTGITNLTGGQSYPFVINAKNSSGPVTIKGDITLPIPPPSALGGITFSNQTPTSFTVRWTGGTGATSYDYTLNGAAITSNPNNNGAGNTATFTGLTGVAGQSPLFVINAKNSSGPVTTSSNVTLPVAPPTALGGITFSNQTPTSFIVTWTGGTGATSYDYTLNSAVIIPNPNNNGAGNTATFTGITNLTGGQSYPFVINAKNSSGTVTTNGNVTLPIPPPAALGGITFSNQTPTSFTVRWTGGTGATSYDYTLNGAAIISNPNNNGAGNTATFTGITNLTAGQSYPFVINAKNSSGPVTIKGDVTLPPPPPTALSNITFNNQTPNSFTVSWTGGTGATSYTYTLNSSAITPTPNNNGSGNTATFTNITNLTGGQSYPFVISAINSTLTVTGTGNVTLPIPPPTILGSIIFSNQTISGFTVKWTGGVGATSYTYTLNNNAVVPNPNNNGAGNTATFTGLTGLTVGQSYPFVISAINSTATITGSSSVTIQLEPTTAPPTTTPPIPTAPPTVNTPAIKNVETLLSAPGASLSTVISTALASTTPVNVITAVLSNGTPAAFSALINVPALQGTSVPISPGDAANLYSKMEKSSIIDKTKPLSVCIPSATGTISALTSGTNIKLAIDLTVTKLYPFLDTSGKPIPGYSINVVNGIQYYITPTNISGTEIEVGTVINIPTSDGLSTSFTVADLDVVIVPTPNNILSEMKTPILQSTSACLPQQCIKTCDTPYILYGGILLGIIIITFILTVITLNILTDL
jgi:hypothetical protein